MINKIDFNAKNLTSNAGLSLQIENAKNNAFLRLLLKCKLTSILIDIDSSVVNIEGHQEGASKRSDISNVKIELLISLLIRTK